MADRVLFISWGENVHGREERGLEVFNETVGMYGRFQQDGRIESFEPFLLDPHGGGLAGFIVIRGERTQLDALRVTEEQQRLIARAAAVVDDVGLVNAYGDEALARQLGYFQEASGALA